MDWLLPPALPWPQFLRLLRHPSPPKGWLEEAASLQDLQRRPQLLRWIAQHRKSPAHLRLALLPRLPWRVLCVLSEDPSAHPQARSLALERLQAQWTTLSLGERRSLAPRAPRALWPRIWAVPDRRALQGFLQHPKLGLEMLLSLVLPPLLPEQADALLASRWNEVQPLALQVLATLDATLALPEPRLVLGQAAPWIRRLEEGARILAASRMTHPALRRMTRGTVGGLLSSPDGCPPRSPRNSPSHEPSPHPLQPFEE